MDELRVTSAHCPLKHFFLELAVSQHDVWRYISPKQTFDRVSALQIFNPYNSQCQQSVKQPGLSDVIRFRALNDGIMTLTSSGASPSSLSQLVWVGSPGPSAVVSTQPNGHRWLGLLCLLQPSWHGSLGRPAAPWPAASMGHSNTAITSWCFVSIGVAQDEIWLSTLKYGFSWRRKSYVCVKCRRWAAEFCVFLLRDAKPVFTHDVSQSDDTLRGQSLLPSSPARAEQSPRWRRGVSGCLV